MRSRFRPESVPTPDSTVWRLRHTEGEVPALRRVAFRGKGVCAAFGIGLPMRRHPGMGAAQLPAVGVVDLLKTKQVEEKSLRMACRRAPIKFTRVNLLISFGSS